MGRLKGPMMGRLVVVVLAGLLAALPAQAAKKGPAAEAWPVRVTLPDDLVAAWQDRRIKPGMKHHARIWTPPEATRLRALLLIANNSDLFCIGEHAAVRAMAARQGMGIVFLEHFSGNVIERVEPPDLADRTMSVLLEEAAKATGLEDFRTAPWITLGKSSRGRFPFRMAWWFPDRVIATISYHGEVPTWPMPDWSKLKDQSVLHLSVNGLSEWDGTWYRHVRPGLLNYHRHTGLLGHQLVIYGVDHGYYPDYYLYPNFGQRLEKEHRFIRCTDVWDYLAGFMASAMKLRVPAEPPAAGLPVTLKPVDRAGGYLVHPRAPEELLGTKWFALRQAEDGGDFQVIPWPDEPSPVFDAGQGVLDPAMLIRPAAEVPEQERGHFMWLPDREAARDWLKMHRLYKLGDRVLGPEEGS